MALQQLPTEIPVELYPVIGGLITGNVPDLEYGVTVAWNVVGYGAHLVVSRKGGSGDQPEPQHQVFTREELATMLTACSNPPEGAQAALPALPWKVIIGLVADWLSEYLSK